MMRSDPPAARGEGRFDRHALGWLALAYPLFYALGFLAKPGTGSAAIWPAHAVAFAAFLLLPMRLWLPVCLGMVSWDLLSQPMLHWATSLPGGSVAMTCSFTVANILTAAGPAALARGMRLYRRHSRFALVISPLWIIALFFGGLPGALWGAATRARLFGIGPSPADTGLWLLASVLSIVTFGPIVFGFLRGFPESTRIPARHWEGWVVACIVLSLFACFATVPWLAMNSLMEPMLFAAPLAWLALRFSHRATNVGVVVVALGVVCIAEYGLGIYQDLTSIAGWREISISLDVFLVVGCGGALLVNLMILKQRALLDALSQEHLALRDYARALGAAEDTARRKTAADLHDGIGQVLAGQSMTLAAMRVHTPHPPLSVLLDEAMDASREAQEGLREMIQDLSPPDLDHASLEQMLRWLAEFFERRHGFTVAWRVIGAANLPRDPLQLIYRCVRELLMNARKHSQRQCAEVEVDLSADMVEITVIDEGIGFDVRRDEPLSASRFGLAQLRERVRAAGGTLALDAVVGEGCRAIVRLPAPG